MKQVQEESIHKTPTLAVQQYARLHSLAANAVKASNVNGYLRDGLFTSYNDTQLGRGHSSPT